MRRRDFITFIGSVAAAGPLAARAEMLYSIVILHSGFPRRTPIDLFNALRERGYEDGRTAKVELLGAEGDPDRLKALIAGIVSEKPLRPRGAGGRCGFDTASAHGFRRI